MVRQGFVLALEEDGLKVEATIDVLDRAGAVLATRMWSATYGEYFPNGERCGSPCVQARLTEIE